MYVGYVICDGYCYRFSTPDALQSFLRIYPASWEVHRSEAEYHDIIRNGHDYIK